MFFYALSKLKGCVFGNGKKLSDYMEEEYVGWAEKRCPPYKTTRLQDFNF